MIPIFLAPYAQTYVQRIALLLAGPEAMRKIKDCRGVHLPETRNIMREKNTLLPKNESKTLVQGVRELPVVDSCNMPLDL